MYAKAVTNPRWVQTRLVGNVCFQSGYHCMVNIAIELTLNWNDINDIYLKVRGIGVAITCAICPLWHKRA